MRIVNNHCSCRGTDPDCEKEWHWHEGDLALAITDGGHHYDGVVLAALDRNQGTLSVNRVYLGENDGLPHVSGCAMDTFDGAQQRRLREEGEVVTGGHGYWGRRTFRKLDEREALGLLRILHEARR